MKRLLTIAIYLCFASISFAQLTHQQKLTDFKALVGVYNKQYGPYEWKVKAFNFDLLNIQSWLQRVEASNDDISFYDICVRYVASLQDSHDEFILPSTYEAYVPITADIYDGRVLIDFIDRTVLDAQTYPFAIGDELLSVDGTSVSDWIFNLGPYSANGQGNPVSRNRLAVATMLDRYQGYYPYANKVDEGDKAIIYVKSQAGKISSYSIPWYFFGLSLDHQGPVPNPHRRGFAPKSAFEESTVKLPMRQLAKAETNRWGVYTGELPAREEVTGVAVPAKLRELQNFSALQADHVLAGGLFPFSSRFPEFNPPPGFKLRLGSKSTDEFLSGTFLAGTSVVGFIRIPSFSPTSQSNALKQFQTEITFFQQNTAGLVIDLMGNGGGNICYANTLLRYLNPQPFQALPIQLRATQNWLTAFVNRLETLESQNAPHSDIDLVSGMLDEVQQALAKNRGLTDPVQAYSPVSLCSSGSGLMYLPGTDSSGNNVAFTKPILLLTNSFTISAAEFFAAALQDLQRVSVYGVRTDGAGGNVNEYDETVGPYAEGSVRITRSIAVRNHMVSTPGLPPGPYIENIGIQPDYLADFQTQANLLSGGQPFVNGFVQVMGILISGGH